MEQVVISGLGVCTPRGQTVSELWENITLSGPDPKSETSDSLDLFQRKKLSGFERAQALSEKAAIEALKDAGLWEIEQLTGVNPQRIGCTLSASKPFFQEGSDPTEHYSASLGQTPFALSPAEGGGVFSVVPPETVNRLLRQRLGLEGESRNVVAACATGAYAIALGATWIKQGLCDVVVAGSVEPFPHPLIEAGFQRMGVLSREAVMRPFDRRRSGFLLAEGAGVVILESEQHARTRQARWHARLIGWGCGADAHSAVAFNSNGSRIAEVIRIALRRARLAPEGVRHVNAHGTATRLNDWIETQALKQAFGSRADRLMISATKGVTGHLLGAAGSVELILTTLALKHQYIPPTAHLDEADPACPLDYTPRRGHPAAFEHAVSLSFGFGGPIGALIVSRN